MLCIRLGHVTTQNIKLLQKVLCSCVTGMCCSLRGKSSLILQDQSCCYIKLFINTFMPVVSFDIPENMRKPLVLKTVP